MALNHVYAEEMLQLTGTWIKPSSPAHAAIMAIPLLAALMPRVRVAHDVLAAAVQPAPDARLRKLIEEQTAKDLRHDTIIGAVIEYLTASANLLGGEAGAALIALRDTLVPDGMAATQKTYRAESGQAAQLAERLTDELRETLAAIKVGSTGVSFLTFIEEWLALGSSLGAGEDERALLLAAPRTKQAQQILSARQAWARVVNAMFINAGLAEDELDEETHTLIFGPILLAEKVADRRARAGKKGEPAEEEETPKEGEGGAAKPEEAKGEDTKGGAAKPEEAKGGAAKPEEAKGGAAKPGYAKDPAAPTPAPQP